MWTIAMVAAGAEKGTIEHGLEAALAHAQELQLRATITETLKGLADEVNGVSALNVRFIQEFLAKLIDVKMQAGSLCDAGA